MKPIHTWKTKSKQIFFIALSPIIFLLSLVFIIIWGLYGFISVWKTYYYQIEYGQGNFKECSIELPHRVRK